MYRNSGGSVVLDHGDGQQPERNVSGGELGNQRSFRPVVPLFVGCSGGGAAVLLDFISHILVMRVRGIPTTWQNIRKFSDRTGHVELTMAVCALWGLAFAFVVGWVFSVREKTNVALAVVGTIVALCTVFVLGWIVFGFSGWLIWAVVGLGACAVSFAIGWLWPKVGQLKLSLGE